MRRGAKKREWARPTPPNGQLSRMRYTAPMRLMPLAIAALACAGCVSQPPPSYEALVAAVEAGETVDVAALREAFLATPAFPERAESLAPLERQAMRFIDEEPLRAGPVGSAILDQHRASIVGHYALAKFYEYVEREDAAQVHHAWVRRLTQALEDSHDGSAEAPFPVFSAAEALAYLRASGRQPVGSIYRTAEERRFTLVVAATPPNAAMQTIHFDMRPAYRAAAQRAPDQELLPGALIGHLARQDDPAAQAAVGVYLASQDRFEEAIDWLTAATRTGNILANLMLADVYLVSARRLEKGPAQKDYLALVTQNYLQAIDAGSDEAMLRLADMHLRDDEDGAELADEGVALLHQAAALGNARAHLYLAQLHLAGEHVAEDAAASETHFLRAAELDYDRAKVLYARFLLSADANREFTARAYDWIAELAQGDAAGCGGQAEQRPTAQPCAEARLILGELHARGRHVRQSHRKARSWFKSAVKAAPETASIVNEVAWWLTVTQIERLKDERYALSIMDHVMQRDAAARKQPAYLDTWAAAHAANGDFARAVALQQEALREANAQGLTHVIEELRRHLAAFEAGETITDPLVP